MTAGEPEELYALGRDEGESSRLNQQHVFLFELTENSLIHSSIPKDRILNVADVATGTGVWLKDASELLKRSAAKTAGHYHGFDISPAQFPGSPGELDFSLHDVLKPFPKEHVGCYDLVHVRLLILGLKAVDYRTVVQNVTSLLRPGGYIQWLELEPLTLSMKNAGNSPAMHEIRQVTNRAIDHLGLSFEPPATIYRECEAAGLKNVTFEAYDIASQGNRHQVPQRWLARAMRGILPSFLVRSGEAESEDAANQTTDDILHKYDIECGNGAVPAMDFKMVVAQKA